MADRTCRTPSFLVDALVAAGADADSEAMQRALVFVSRCQNLETSYNTTPFATKVNDGGFYYTPAAGGTSQAGQTDNGGLRSYASMTYAGLKSMIYAGVEADDPRVTAAVDWIKKNYRPGFQPRYGRRGTLLLLPQRSPRHWLRWNWRKSRTPPVRHMIGAPI